MRDLDGKKQFVFTRGEGNLSLAERTKLAREKNATAFVSLHVGTSENAQASGIEVFYSPDNANAIRSRELGETFTNNLKFRQGSQRNQLKTANYVVLKDTPCASVLVTLGFLSNTDDVNYLLSEKNQTDLAKQIVEVLDQIH